MTLKEAMHSADPYWGAALDQPCMDLGQGHVAVLGNQVPDEVALRLYLARMPVTGAQLAWQLPDHAPATVVASGSRSMH